MKEQFRQLCPPMLWKLLSEIKSRSLQSAISHTQITNPEAQDLDLYWTEEMAKVLEEWGANTVWNEIQLLVANCQGKVLDIACGTGKTIEILKDYQNIEVHGCDISELLIGKGVERGIVPSRLTVCDATQMPFEAGQFRYAYSIGSLEHFTLDGILGFLKESRRVASEGAFHMIPVSRSGKDEGWITRFQSYFNNSDDWWLERFRTAYSDVKVVTSGWNDQVSLGRWFLCYP